MAKQVALPPKYSVPANWRWIEMGEVTFVRSGFPFNSKKFSNESNGRKPLIRIRDVVRGSTETFTDEECSDEYIVHNGDILIGMDGDFNVAKWNTGDALLNQRVCYICSSSDALLNDFLFFFLPEQLKKINAATPSVTVKHLSTKTLAKTPIPLPPLPEQQRIVERIESLFAKLDEAKEKAQAVVDGFEEQKAAILHQAFTGELTKEWRREQRIDLDSWRMQRLSETTISIIDGDRGNNYPKKNEFSPKGYCVFLNAKNVTKNGFRFDQLECITKEKDEQLRTGRLERGDIVLTTRGTIGNTAIYDESVPYEHLRINSGMVIYRGGDEFKKQYLVRLYQSKVISDQIERLRTGTAQPQLPIKVMKMLLLPIPTLREQQEIVRILDSLLDKQQQARDAAAAVLDQIDTMKKAILARAFRGELGTNDPQEESAMELVRRALVQELKY